MTQYRIEPITEAAFARFGTILAARPGIPRVDFAAPIENRRPAARPNLALVNPPVATLPFRPALMERHPFSTQAFFPLAPLTLLLFVAPGTADPDLANARAFAVPPGHAISYAAATWHIGMTLLGPPGPMAMLVHEDGSGGDTEFRRTETIEVIA